MLTLELYTTVKTTLPIFRIKPEGMGQPYLFNHMVDPITFKAGMVELLLLLSTGFLEKMKPCFSILPPFFCQLSSDTS